MMEEKLNQVTDERNPLKIHTVLSCMFNYLQMNDLKVMRQVCKQWESEASLIITSHSTVLFSDETDVLKFTRAAPRTNPSLLFKRFKFTFPAKNSFLDSNNNLETNEFLNIHGKNVQWLHVDFPPMNTGLRMGTLKNLLFNTPNLRDLSIEQIPRHISNCPDLTAVIGSAAHLKSLKLFLQESYGDMRFLLCLFQSFPLTLESLYLYGDERSLVLEVHKKVINLLANLQKACGKLSSLNTLQINFPLDPQDLKIVSALSEGVKLRNLFLALNFTHPKEKDAFYDFLEGHKTALEILSIKAYFSKKTGGKINFPYMTNLRKLKLNFNFIDFENFNLKDVLEKFPNLTILEFLVQPPISIVFRASDLANETLVHKRLEKLKFGQGGRVRYCEDLKDIGKMVPNLQILQIVADNSIMKGIWEGFENLEELYLTIEGKVNDEGFTGIPLSQCKELYRNLRQKSKSQFANLYPIGSHGTLRIGKFIGNLTKLRQFSLIESSLQHTIVTDISILFGLIHCKRLNNISLESGITDWLSTSTNGVYLTDKAIERIGGTLDNLLFLNLDCKWISRGCLIGLKKRVPKVEITHSKMWKLSPEGWEMTIGHERIKIPMYYCRECKRHGRTCSVTDMYSHSCGNGWAMDVETLKRTWFRACKFTLPFLIIVVVAFILLVLLL